MRFWNSGYGMHQRDFVVHAIVCTIVWLKWIIGTIICHLSNLGSIKIVPTVRDREMQKQKWKKNSRDKKTNADKFKIVLRHSMCYWNIVANRCNAITPCNRLTDPKRRISFQTVETHCIRVKFKIDSNLVIIFFSPFHSIFISIQSVHAFSNEPERHLSKYFTVILACIRQHVVKSCMCVHFFNLAWKS